MINPLLDGPSESVRSCQMQTLYIDFKDLGWRVSTFWFKCAIKSRMA